MKSISKKRDDAKKRSNLVMRPAAGGRHLRALFHRLGFVELADDHPRTDRQFNALFVRATRSVRMRIAVTLLLARARVRYLAVRVLRAACPACVQRYQAIRGRRTRGFGG